MKPKYEEKEKLCYKDTESFILRMKKDNIYEDIAKDVEARSDTSNCKLHRPLTRGKDKNLVGLMEDELGGYIMTKFVA